MSKQIPVPSFVDIVVKIEELDRRMASLQEKYDRLSPQIQEVTAIVADLADREQTMVVRNALAVREMDLANLKDQRRSLVSMMDSCQDMAMALRWTLGCGGSF